jgi:uncharacterized protein (TIGR03382 family)
MRLEIGYGLAAALVLGVLAVAWLTRRYRRYKARRVRGHYDKPVWKPFWMR